MMPNRPSPAKTPQGTDRPRSGLGGFSGRGVGNSRLAVPQSVTGKGCVRRRRWAALANRGKSSRRSRRHQATAPGWPQDLSAAPDQAGFVKFLLRPQHLDSRQSGGTICSPVGQFAPAVWPRRLRPSRFCLNISYIPQPSAYTPQPVSFRRQPGSRVRQPVSFRRQPGTRVRQPVSFRRQPVSRVRQPVSFQRQPVSRVRQPGSHQRRPGSRVRPPVTHRRALVTRLGRSATSWRQARRSAEHCAARPVQAHLHRAPPGAPVPEACSPRTQSRLIVIMDETEKIPPRVTPGAAGIG